MSRPPPIPLYCFVKIFITNGFGAGRGLASVLARQSPCHYDLTDPGLLGALAAIRQALRYGFLPGRCELPQAEPKFLAPWSRCVVPQTAQRYINEAMKERCYRKGFAYETHRLFDNPGIAYLRRRASGFSWDCRCQPRNRPGGFIPFDIAQCAMG